MPIVTQHLKSWPCPEELLHRHSHTSRRCSERVCCIGRTGELNVWTLLCCVIQKASKQGWERGGEEARMKGGEGERKGKKRNTKETESEWSIGYCSLQGRNLSLPKVLAWWSYLEKENGVLLNHSLGALGIFFCLVTCIYIFFNSEESVNASWFMCM